MKARGLIGAMRWESTVIYYRLMNEIVRDQLGGLYIGIASPEMPSCRP